MNEDVSVGDVVRIHDRRDRSWLGIVKRIETSRGGCAVYHCDLWRVESGRVVTHRDSPHHRGEFDLALRAAGLGVGR